MFCQDNLSKYMIITLMEYIWPQYIFDSFYLIYTTDNDFIHKNDDRLTEYHNGYRLNHLIMHTLIKTVSAWASLALFHGFLHWSQ